MGAKIPFRLDQNPPVSLGGVGGLTSVDNVFLLKVATMPFTGLGLYRCKIIVELQKVWTSEANLCTVYKYKQQQSAPTRKVINTRCLH